MNCSLTKLILLLVLLLPTARASAYYDPGVQRWINRDPAEEVGFKMLESKAFGEAPQAANLYTYVGGDPIDRLDACGLFESQWPANSVRACFLCAKLHPGGRLAKIACCIHANKTCIDGCQEEYGFAAWDEDPVALKQCLADCKLNAALCATKAGK